MSRAGAKAWPIIAVALLAGAAPAGPSDGALQAALRAHVEVLASDAFGGREPGTDGETRTLRYLGRQWFEIGLVSGTNQPGHAWFAPVELVAREPVGSSAGFVRAGRRTPAGPGDVLVVTSDLRNLVRDAPLLFVGRGVAPPPPRGELAGRVAVMLDSLPAAAVAAGVSDREQRLLAAGAAGVLTVLDGKRTLEEVAAWRRRTGYALAGDAIGGDLEAYMTPAFAARLFGPDLGAIADGAAPRPLAVAATLEASTRETRIATHNLIGRLPGRRPQSGAVLLIAHWDHFGRCAAPPAEDQICNGAIDNASGLAVLTEVARMLARGRQLDRDVYFLATTGEELGLLGAEAFAENPPLPLDQIVAAFNIDSPALARRGDPLSIVGHGRTPLDPWIARVAQAEKRRLAQSPVAEDFLRRQDGWALLRHDVPAVMVSANYADPARVARFMETTYHRPSDEATPGLELSGAADEARFQAALVRWFATVKSYPGKTR